MVTVSTSEVRYRTAELDQFARENKAPDSCYEMRSNDLEITAPSPHSHRRTLERSISDAIQQIALTNSLTRSFARECVAIA